jgi:hypothetical protein
MSLAPPRTRRAGIDAGAASLWASAFVIAAMILSTLATSPGPGPAAQAGLVGQAGGLTVLTALKDDSEDIILVLDGRNERLNVYTVRNRQSIELEASYDVTRMFTQARDLAGGGRRR